MQKHNKSISRMKHAGTIANPWTESKRIFMQHLKVLLYANDESTIIKLSWVWD